MRALLRGSRLVMAVLSLATVVGLAACDSDSTALAPEMEDEAVLAEIENIEIYDLNLALSLPADVRTVFENNRAASLDKHLPAFEQCS